MKRKNVQKYLSLILVLAAALLITGVAAAQEAEFELEGTVIAIDPDNSTLEVEVENDLGEIETYTVQVGPNFDFESIAIGDLIELKGTTDPDGNLVVSELKIQERARDREQEMDGEGDGNFCTDAEKSHPVAESMAETYGVTYEEVISWFCNEEAENRNGLGQIMLALQTAELTGEPVETYLGAREEGMGWGQIWQEVGEKPGKPDKQDPPGQVKKEDKQGDPASELPPGQQKKLGECPQEMTPEECEEYEWGLDGEWIPPGQAKKNR
jgi:hypothetical protein